MAKLKQFAYYPQHGDYANHQLYITATSRKQVVEMMEKIGNNVSVGYIKDFFSMWGTESGMEGIEITEPCIYAVKGERWSKTKNKPKRIL